MELATLHDPLLTETLALCTQASAHVAQEIDECGKIQDEVSQAIQSSTIQVDHGKPQEIQGLQPEEQQSPLSDSPQMIVDQDQNTLQSQGSQPPLTPDSHGIQTNFDKHCDNLQVKGVPPNRPRLIDGPSEDISDNVCQRGTELLYHKENKPASNEVITSSIRASVDIEMVEEDSSDSYSYHHGYNAKGEVGTGVQSLHDECTSGSVLNSAPCTETEEHSVEHL